MDKKCKDCWYFAEKYWGEKDCCTVDEDREDEYTGLLHFVNADDECCNLFEQDLTKE